MINYQNKLLLTVLFIFLCINSNAADDHKLLLENEKNTIEIYHKLSHSVVNITSISVATDFWNREQIEIPRGSGSGFVWDKKGHIVTNFHVVEGSDSFIVTFNNDKKQYKAKPVGGEPRKDIAVLKLTSLPNKLTPIFPGNSSTLQVGQKAIAIGNPFGMDNTVTTGIISALNRRIVGITGLKIYGMIQTDASINPGNSGGPLFNSSGELIGMNTMIFSKTGTSTGIGFAIPSDTINRMVPQIIKYGKVIQPGLGIAILPDQYKNRLGIEKGIVITGFLDKKNPISKSGLRTLRRDEYGRIILGDIIIAIDGKETKDLSDIYNILQEYKVGDYVEITYLRNNSKKKLKVKLTKVQAE